MATTSVHQFERIVLYPNEDGMNAKWTKEEYQILPDLLTSSNWWGSLEGVLLMGDSALGDEAGEGETACGDFKSARASLWNI